MVYITAEDGKEKKFACIKCIKGHRSSKCNHTNRELFEIKKKGRPVSQCESCRQLRKTKQIHIKCMCHLNVKLKDTVNESDTTTTSAMDEDFRHSDLSANVTTTTTPPLPPPLTTTTTATTATTTTIIPLAGSCIQCERPSLYCICKRNYNNTSSTSSSDGSVTPPVYTLSYPTERPTYSAGLNTDKHSPIASPTVNSKNPNLRHLTIPIHDPSDDIDSDTPIYKSHEEDTILGNFTNTSSEELMDQIYSGFIEKCPSNHSSPLLREADQQLVELSKED